MIVKCLQGLLNKTDLHSTQYRGINLYYIKTHLSVETRADMCVAPYP